MKELFEKTEIQFPWTSFDAVIDDWLNEDVGLGDITTDNLQLDGVNVNASVLAKCDGVLSGLPALFKVMGKTCKEIEVVTSSQDGMEFRKGDVVASFSADARGVLIGERTAMNLLTHLSGVASLTKKFVDEVSHTSVKIADTRKTLPGLRALQKYAVRCGGGVNHRYDLSQSVMLKDNHLALIQISLDDVIKNLRKRVGPTVKIEVEADSLEKVKNALNAGVDIIMLDNMSLKDGQEAVKLIDGQALVEVSGGINLGNVRGWAEIGVDVISIGALTHSAPASDFSLEIELG